MEESSLPHEQHNQVSELGSCRPSLEPGARLHWSRQSGIEQMLSEMDIQANEMDGNSTGYDEGMLCENNFCIASVMVFAN